MDWLEATRDVTSQHLAPEQRPSPFIAHHGVSAADSDRRYTIATYSNDGRFLARVGGCTLFIMFSAICGGMGEGAFLFLFRSAMG